MGIASIALIAAILPLFFFLASFTSISFREQERRAGLISLGGLIGLTAATAVFAWLGGTVAQAALYAMLGLYILLAFLFFVPGKKHREPAQHPRQRYDERRIMFARMRMQPDATNYQDYYLQHPEDQAGDDAIRQNGWHSRQELSSRLMDAAAHASFAAVGGMREMVDGEVASGKIDIPAAERSAYLCGLAQFFGALEAGVTLLKPEHIYSHVGRGAGEWGEEIALNHTHAIALTTEMARENIISAPRQPVMAESARQYARAGLTAVMLAAAIRAMGYEARAHIDGNYRVICPLVARDAGLGEIGRMGLLMTPRQGPRVRLAVVTTNLPLQTHDYQPKHTIIDFCERCNKCAVNCPGKAIPTGERIMIDGALRWQVDQQRCYHFWMRAGTDCGRCMAVCPLAHSDHWTHNLLRQGIQCSTAFRQMYVKLDRWLYGAHPQPKSAPAWLPRDH
jgi:ferredoxin